MKLRFVTREMKLRFTTSTDCQRPPAGFRKQSFLSRVTQPELRHEHPSGDREASPQILVAKLRFVTREMKLRFTTPTDCQRPPAGFGKQSFFSCVTQPELRHEKTARRCVGRACCELSREGKSL
ncbi:hypothetical protein CKO25_16210 [Thiocapsa imhoffii]|uniref:Uncharacterized protein n=1 Tax=Thiocapsa imhoffii TaxID=382777 RepID=A0A9X1BAI9_9GAMM|nr:hypothetical protein [Thiocapsa imhoffii]MBK1646160.1 hypothetical protein [Thiocapsa imhoffii]